MKKNYEIKGMSCGGCINTVRQALMKNPAIQDVEVQLNPPVANVSMDKLVDVAELQAQLSKAGNYSIKELG